MREMLKGMKNYSIVLLKDGPNYKMAGAGRIIWEHGRRNFQLRDEGALCIVCPVTEGDGLAGLYIFKSSVDEAKHILDGDPAMQAGIFVYEVYGCKGFPGDCLR